MSESIVPYGKEGGSKREQVELMFDNISSKYDFLNHFLSLGIDRVWRRKSLQMVAQAQPGRILDVATGTGDFAIAAKKKYPNAEVVGIDISKGMLEIGNKKLLNKKLDGIRLVQADSASIPFAEGSFDLAIVAFGVRNFEHLEQGLGDMHRVLKPDGELVVLEFSKPKPFPFKQMYNLYFNHILPFFGEKISKDPAAYTYLPESVKHFPEGADFVDKLKQVGFTRVQHRPLTFGVSTIYHGIKAK